MSPRQSLRTVVFLVLAAAGSLPAFAQFVLYQQDFATTNPPALPGDWFNDSPEIFSELPSAGLQSSGYAEASGGNQLVARNCNPDGETRRFQVDGISTEGYSNLTVRFGHRRTASFTPPVTLEWSSNGNDWHAIGYISSQATATWSEYVSVQLHPGTNNQPTLSFRWTYTTNVNNIACHSFAGNYRLDDFRVVAAIALPVELVQFSASVAEEQVELIWQTASERENGGFVVERSRDALQFSEIGRLPGGGTTTELRSYRFLDLHPLPGPSYYRLRQVDLDGRYAFSPIVFVQTGREALVQIFPSPAIDMLHIQLNTKLEGTIIWEMYDQTGRALLTGSFEGDKAAIDVSSLPNAPYFLRLGVNDKVEMRMFLKAQ